MTSGMAPSKSSDGDTNEPTEAMEISSDSLLGKHKVETTNLEVENPDENEGGDVEKDEEEEDSDPEWDKDSFDGLEYHSSDNREEYEDKELEKQAPFRSRRIIETKGFFEATSGFPRYTWGGIGPVPGLDKTMRIGITVRQFLANMVTLCLEKYNKQKGFNVILEHVLRANFHPGGTTKYYITFAARESDSPDAPLLEYQAKAAWSAGITYPILCRPTSPPKMVERDQVKEVAEVMEVSS